MLFFKGKKLAEINTKVDSLINLVNYQMEIIKTLSIKLNNLEINQKLLEEMCSSIVQSNNSEVLKLEILESRADKNLENIVNLEKIFNKSKLEILKSINNIEKNIISAIKEEVSSNSEMYEKIKTDICDKITSSAKEVIDIKDIISKSRAETLKIANSTEKNIISAIKEEVSSNSEMQEKIKTDIYDKIEYFAKNLSDEINAVDKEVRLLLLNSIMEQLQE